MSVVVLRPPLRYIWNSLASQNNDYDQRNCRRTPLSPQKPRASDSGHKKQSCRCTCTILQASRAKHETGGGHGCCRSFGGRRVCSASGDERAHPGTIDAASPPARDVSPQHYHAIRRRPMAVMSSKPSAPAL